MTGPTVEYRVGHVIDELRKMPPESVQMVVTSPPYFGLRKYEGEQEVSWANGVKCAFGLEATPELYVEHTMEIMREIKRVLRNDGVVFWNIGDSYAGGGRGEWLGYQEGMGEALSHQKPPPGLKPKDLMLVPFRVALAAQADGWWVRNDIIWSKSSTLPENVTDRCTKTHEYIFLFSKSRHYYFDNESIREKSGGTCRTVWTMSTASYPDSHFAVFPPEIPTRAIKAGTSEKGACPKCGAPWARIIERTVNEPLEDHPYCGDGQLRAGNLTPAGHGSGGHSSLGGQQDKITKKTLGWAPTCECGIKETVPCIVLDPFCGSGTTLEVARNLSRSAIGIDISNQYKQLAVKRADLNTKNLDGFI